MTAERRPGTPTTPLQGFLRDVLSPAAATLLLNTHTRPHDKAIRRCFDTIVGFSPQEQDTFVRVLLDGVAEESAMWDTDRRDVALTLLELVPMDQIPDEKRVSYLGQAIERLDPESADMLGSVSSVLQAVRLVYPTLSMSSQRMIMHGLNAMIDRFPEDEQEYIRSQVGSSVDLPPAASPTTDESRNVLRGVFSSLEERKPKKVDPAIQKRHQDVKRLRLEGKMVAEIAEILGISKDQVKHSVSILMKAGEIPSQRNMKRGPTTEVKKRIDAVLDLARQGKGPQEIAKLLGIPKQSVADALKRIRSEDPTAVPSRGRTSPKGIIARDKGVLRLTSQGKSTDEICKALGITVPQLVKSVARIRSKDPEFRAPQSPEDIQKRKTRSQVADFFDLGLSVEQIMEETYLSRGVVRSILKAEGRIIGRKNPTKGEIIERDNRVAELRRRGLTNPKIAEALGLTWGQTLASLTRLTQAGRIEKRAEGRTGPHGKNKEVT